PTIPAVTTAYSDDGDGREHDGVDELGEISIGGAVKLSHDGDDNRSCRGRVRCCWLEHELNHHHEPSLRRRRRSWSSRFRPETYMMIHGGVRSGKRRFMAET
ncbi:unnamed protein product, partial [Brassica napus]